MAIVKTEAFVLKTLKYGESSKIVSLFTKDYGKVNAIVKGARNYKSKFCGTLESMNYLDVVLYLKQNRELQLLTGAEYKQSYPQILNDIDKLSVAYRIIDITNKSVMSNEVNQLMFELLISTYSNLNSALNNYYCYILFFQIELAKILGIGPDFLELIGDKETFFDNNEFYVRKSLLDSVRSFNKSKLESIESLTIGENELTQLILCFEKYLSLHSHGFSYLNTTKIFNQLI